MPKFFVKEEQIKENKIVIIGEDVKHITQVLRKKIEDVLRIGVIETGKSYEGKIVQIEKEQVLCEIQKEALWDTESNVHLTIFQGIPKADKMELIIQKCTELGIQKVVPVEWKRCIIKAKDIVKKQERWQKIAEVAAKQSGRDRIPIVESTIKVQDVIKEIENYDMMILAYEEEKETTLKRVIQELREIGKKEYKIGILIGPEGGIEEEEAITLQANGARVVTLGKRILRTETVALMMSSILIYELEE